MRVYLARMAELVPMEGIRMYQHILIPTDGSKLAHKAAVHALSLAKAVGARTTVLTVDPSFVTPRFAEHGKEWSALKPEVSRTFAVGPVMFSEPTLKDINSKCVVAA